MNNKFLRAFLALTLACAMLITLFACKKDDVDEGSVSSDSQSESVESESESESESEPVADKVENKGANTDDVWDETTPV